MLTVDGTKRIGENALSMHELALMEAYEELGRSDLAGYVEKGRKYHHLPMLAGGTGDITYLNAARRAFLDLPDDYSDLPNTIEEWQGITMERHKDDEGLQQLIARRPATRPPRLTRKSDNLQHRLAKAGLKDGKQAVETVKN